MTLLTWARGLALKDLIGLSVVLLLSVGMLIVFHGAMKVNVSIPPESTLQTSTGILEPAAGIKRGKSYNTIGVLSTGEGQFLPFSCAPISSDVRCLYSTSYDQSPLVGKTVTIEYFSSQTWLYPTFNVGDGANVYVVPRQYSNIVMAATVNDGDGSKPLFTYAQAVGRFGKTSSGLPLDYLFCGMILLAFLPGIALRLVRGRDFSFA